MPTPCYLSCSTAQFYVGSAVLIAMLLYLIELRFALLSDGKY